MTREHNGEDLLERMDEGFREAATQHTALES